MLDATLRVRYNTAKVCNMTQYYSERSNRKIVHDNLVLGPKAHLHHEPTELREAVDVGNKVTSQNNIQKIANIVILQRVLLASVKRKKISKSIQVTCQCEAATYNTV